MASRVSPGVGRTPRTQGMRVLGIVGVLGGCGGTSGLILGETAVPETEAGLAVDAGFDAGCASCFTPIAWDATAETPQQGGTTGSPSVDTCPFNQAIIGYQGFLTPASVGLILVGGVQAICGELYLSASSNQVGTSVGVSLPLRGTSKASPWTQMCPANEVVVGFKGRSGDDLDQVAFECAPWIAQTSPGATTDGGPSLTIGTVVTLAPAGGDGGTPYKNECPAGQLVVGDNLRSGEWIDAFGVVCATPMLEGDGGPT